MFKLRDVFKVAVVGAAGYFGGALGAKFGQGAFGKKVGTALGRSLMSRGGGRDMGTASAQYTRPPNLSQFSMPTYASGAARAEMIPGSSLGGTARATDGITMNALWERRLDKYLLRKKAIEQTIVKV